MVEEFVSWSSAEQDSKPQRLMVGESRRNSSS
ncbi:MAG: hypothetical protein ACI841_004282 [Planctomycetota bacterium]|jgi:hypothetical protein